MSFAMIREYMDLGHAEPVPTSEPSKEISELFYLPVHNAKKKLNFYHQGESCFWLSQLWVFH